MKKFLILLLTLALILGVFVSCNSNLPIDDETSSSPSESINTEITESNESNIIENTDTEDKLTEITSETVKPGKPNGLLRQIYTFYSFDEFAFNFSKDANAENSEIQAQKDWFSDNYLKFIEFLTDNNDRILRPVSDGEPIPYYANEGTVAFMIELATEEVVSEMPYHSLPSIYYYLENGITVGVTYPDVILDEDYSSFDNTSEVLSAINSNAVNVTNYRQFSNKVKNVYAKEILIDSATVTAIVYEMNDYNVDGDMFIKVDLYYNGMYITLYGTEYSLSDEFLQSFSMG